MKSFRIVRNRVAPLLISILLAAHTHAFAAENNQPAPEMKTTSTPALPVKHLPGRPVIEVPASIKDKALSGFIDPTTGMKFVTIPGGCFKMGDSFGDGGVEEKPVHKVCLTTFSMGKFEVTNAQYRRYKPEHNSGNHKGNSLNEDNQPVVRVSWNDAVEYAQWLSKKSGRLYRLATEAEWEYAARGDTGSRNYWGDIKEEACNYANVHDETSKRAFPAIPWESHSCSDGSIVAAPVGSFKPNQYGLYDMMGNVWEWTADWYDSAYYAKSPRNNPAGPTTGNNRVNRGGSWADGPRYIRAALRYDGFPTDISESIGFRLVAQEIKKKSAKKTGHIKK